MIQKTPKNSCVTELLNAKTPLWAAARTLLNERWHDFNRCLVTALSSYEPEDIHDLRVSSRRLREGLALFADCYPSGSITPLGKRIRRVTRLLGEIRNRDEALLFFESLRNELDSSCKNELDRMLTAFRGERQHEARELETGLKNISTTELSRLNRQVVNRPCLFTPPNGGVIDPFTPLASFARKSLSSRLGNVLQLIPAASQEEDVTTQHQLRIAVKHFRYRLEILSFLLGSTYKELYTTVKEYQEILGKMHDLDVFASVSRDFYSQPTAATIQAAIAGQRNRLFSAFSFMLTNKPLRKIDNYLRNIR